MSQTSGILLFKERGTVLFHASDPLDYTGENGEDYGDLHNMWMGVCGYSPRIVTRLPIGKEHLLDKLPGGQISYSILNFVRINELYQRIDKNKWHIKPVDILPVGRAARNYAREGVGYVFQLGNPSWCTGYILSPDGLCYSPSYGLTMGADFDEIERNTPRLYYKIVSKVKGILQGSKVT